jgi:hypothetical protein
MRATLAVAAVACTYSVPNVIVRGDPDAGPDGGGGVDLDASADAGIDDVTDAAVADVEPDAALPAALTADLLLHLRADDVSPTDGGRIALWTDVAGNQFSFQQGDDPMRPFFRPRGGSEPTAVEFEEKDHLSLPASPSASFRFAAGISFTAVAVFKTTVTTTERFEQIFGNEFAGSTNRVGFVLDIDSQTGKPIFGLHQGCDGGCTDVLGQADVHDGKWHWIAGVREGDAARLYVDGRSDGTLATGAGVSFEAADDLRIGASAFYALPFVGRVAQIFVWRRSLSDADLALLDAHLRARLPIAP